MEHVLGREDRQEELTKEIKSIVKEIENDDLKVVTFMEYTSPPKEIKPKVIKFNKALELLRLIAKQGKIQKGVWASLNFHEFVSNSQPLGFNRVTGKPVTPPPL
jgi:gentisate 1,2-dioxygenase